MRGALLPIKMLKRGIGGKTFETPDPMQLHTNIVLSKQAKLLLYTHASYWQKKLPMVFNEIFQLTQKRHNF